MNSFTPNGYHDIELFKYHLTRSIFSDCLFGWSFNRHSLFNVYKITKIN
jgi:hypothetical protein